MMTNTMISSAPARHGARIVAALALLALGTAQARADNVLQDLHYSAAPTGAVEVTLELAGPANDANVFTTDDPPRIAIDLPATRNESGKRRITVGNGATSAITALEAGGRTRVIIDLFRPTPFESRAEGNRLIVRVAGGDSATVANVAPAAVRDPAKRLAGTAQVTNIDFRRGTNGSGRVIMSFDSDNVGADFRDDGSGITVDFGNATVPAPLAQRLDVTDFATPVEYVDLQRGPAGARLNIRAGGRYESLAYQTGNEYVIEVVPLPDAIEAELGLGVDQLQGYTGTPVTFNFQNIPVRTVLQLIAEESGLNVVAADTVSGNVTLRLINVPWDQALEIVLRAKNLDQRRDGNVVWVAPQAEIAAYEQAQAAARLSLQQSAPLISEYIAINYGSAEEIAKLLTEDAKTGSGGGGGATGAGQDRSRGFLSPRGSVTFDRRTNTLLINDTAEKVREVRALIALLDRPVDQVLIEARIVVASETFARELGARFGISGGYEDRRGNVVTSSGSQISADRMANLALANRFAGQGSGLPVGAPGPVGGGVLVPSLADRLNVNLPVIAPAGTVGFAILGADYLLDLELSALEAEGRGEVVSSPRVITANQREAIIRQGDEVGYVTVSPQQGSIPIPNVQFKEVLLELAVTPTITQDGRVYLVMSVKKDEISGFVDTSIGQVPQINKREIATAVLVDNSQTVVIGGVYEFKSREDLTKVPFLGDVPILGNMFRKKGRSSEKAELLIFVTPKVLAVSGRPQ
jgi:type IV pilus assembly protein PilQ